MAVHRDILENGTRGTRPKDLVKDIVIQCKDTSTEADEPYMHPTAVDAITLLLNLVPGIEALALNRMPQVGLGSAGSVGELSQALVDSSQLKSLQFTGELMADSSWWISVLLSSLPATIKKLSLNFELDEDNDRPISHFDVARITFASEPNYRFPLQELSFCCVQESQQCDEILRTLLRLSPWLKVVTVFNQPLSADNVLALFAPGRRHRCLNLDIENVPHLPESRYSLQKQRLVSVAVKTGTDFLYYLPFLPPTVQFIWLQMRIEAPYGASYLSEVANQVRACFADRRWCPKLRRALFVLSVPTYMCTAEASALIIQMQIELQKLALERDAGELTEVSMRIEEYEEEEVSDEGLLEGSLGEEEAPDDSLDEDSSVVDEDSVGTHSEEGDSYEDESSGEGTSYEEESDKEVLEEAGLLAITHLE
jgi:hypothetical protein